MALRTYLVRAKDGHPVRLENYDIEGEPRDRTILATTTPQKAHGLFNAQSFTVQATKRLATPSGNGSVELTDLMITFEKKNTSVVTVQFNDGTHQVLIAQCTLTDAPVNMGINFGGRWQGWQSAHVEAIVSAADAIGVVSIGYVKHYKRGSQTYGEWAGMRG